MKPRVGIPSNVLAAADPTYEPLTMSAEQLAHFLYLAKEGYTLRAIRRKMAEAKLPLPPSTPDAQLILLMREHRRDILGEREARAKDTLDFLGLADKLTRVRRMATIAESMEDGAHTDAKKAAEYRRYLGAIQAELEPLNISLTFGDPFGDLLRELADMAERDEGAEGADTGEAFRDPLSEAEGDLV